MPVGSSREGQTLGDNMHMHMHSNTQPMYSKISIAAHKQIQK